MCLGGAREVWDDIRAWETIYGRPWDGLVIATNDIGAHFSRVVHHWVTLHPNRLVERWEPLRRSQGFPDGYVRWSLGGKRPMLDRAIAGWGGDTGLGTLAVAAELGCTRAVLCGMPLTGTPHFAESHERFGPVWYAAASYWRWWRQRAAELRWVRSLSGRTRELLGAPDLDWLRGLAFSPPHSMVSGQSKGR